MDAHNGMLIISGRGIILEANAAFCTATGYRADEIRGRTPAFLRAGIHDAAFCACIRQALRDAGSWRGEMVCRCKDGSLSTYLLSIGVGQDGGGRLSHYVCVFSDITALKEHQRNLEHLAHFDSLTGLPNRTLLMDRLTQMRAAAWRHDRQMAICYLDVDGFKEINDSLGHEAGDRVLVEIAARLGCEIRSGDTVARLGGDEFVMLFAEPGAMHDICAVLDRILASLAHVPVERGLGLLSASVGVTIFPVDDGDPDTLLRHADLAMYQAKRAGRACYRFFHAPGGDPASDGCAGREEPG